MDADPESTVSKSWYAAFLRAVQQDEAATALREAADSEQLKRWTTEITKVVVRSLGPMGWHGAAKGHRSTFLPVGREEYLSLDVAAFTKTDDRRWRFPVAVFELENSESDNGVAYSLWKVLAVRATLRVVICYRRDAAQGVELVRHLSEHVIKELGISGRAALGGETLVVVGSRAESAAFPYGYFKDWILDLNVGRFRRP